MAGIAVATVCAIAIFLFGAFYHVTLDVAAWDVATRHNVNLGWLMSMVVGAVTGVIAGMLP